MISEQIAEKIILKKREIDREIEEDRQRRLKDLELEEKIA